MAKALPTFSEIWNNYPNSHDADAVKHAIGGRVDAAWIANTCVIRLSKALNSSPGHKIIRNVGGLSTVSGADGKWYGYRVREMESYMVAMYGPPTITAEGSPAELVKAVQGRQGIIQFDVRGWSDSSGHFDVWDGGNIRYSDYFNKAHRVNLWELR